MKKKNKVNILVYYEITSGIDAAIKGEKQLKRWRRKWKLMLIEKEKADWRDLYDFF